jgi:hypothetical protein
MIVMAGEWQVKTSYPDRPWPKSSYELATQDSTVAVRHCNVHTPTMTLKNAALLALIGTILATVLLAWTLVMAVLNVLSDGRKDDCGFQILYGPPYCQTPILFVGYQPGRGKKSPFQERADGSEERWPQQSEYASSTISLVDKFSSCASCCWFI